MANGPDYFGQGLRAIRRHLEADLVAPWRELEARIADEVYPGNTHRVQPHILTRIRGYMRKHGHLDEIKHRTHGGREVELLQLTDTAATKREIGQATGRKAKLYGRYLSWAEGPLTDDFPSGVLGVAGERILRASTRIGLDGYAPVGPPGDVKQLLGFSLVGGSYDDAAYLTVEEGGRLLPIVVPFEMKNVRRWLYSDDPEVHKFLYRSAQLQRERPDALICPVIVCRRRQHTLLEMGKDLGFYAIATGIHFVLSTSRIDIRKFEEVRMELAFTDLVQQDGPSQRLVRVLDRSLRRDASAAARRWQARGATFIDHYDELRRELGHDARERTMASLRAEAAAGPLDHLGGW